MADMDPGKIRKTLQIEYLRNEFGRAFGELNEGVYWQPNTGNNAILVIIPWYLSPKVFKEGPRKIKGAKFTDPWWKRLGADSNRIVIPVDGLPPEMKKPVEFFKIVEREVNAPIQSADYDGDFYTLWAPPHMQGAGVSLPEWARDMPSLAHTTIPGALARAPVAQLLGIDEEKIAFSIDEKNMHAELRIPRDYVDRFMERRLKDNAPPVS